MANTLYEYYTGQGQALPSVSARSSTYAGYGLGSAGSYTGTAAQNNALLAALQKGSTSSGTTPTPASASSAASTARRPISISVGSKAEDDYYNSLEKDFNEDDIYDQELRASQGAIDAIEAYYASLVAGEAAPAEARMGQTRAIAARSGTLGSDFGAGMLGETGRYNKQITDTILSEKAAKIQEILSGVQSRAASNIAKKREEVKANTEKYLEYQNTKTQEALDDVASLAGLGFTYEDLLPEEKDTLLEQTGLTEEELNNHFKINRPEEDVLDTIVSGSTYTQIVKDPLTGAIKGESFDLGMTVPANYKTQKLADGSLVFIPDKLDPGKSLDEQILRYTTGMKSSSSTNKGYAFTNDERGKLIAAKLTPADIDAIESDIKTFGIDQALETDALNEAQKSIIKEILSGEGGETITDTYFKDTFDEGSLEDEAKAKGFTKGLFNKRADVDAYIEDMMKKVAEWRTQGYTDQQIIDSNFNL